MTRRDRDWNRPIPQRQQNNARPSALLRGVAGEHLPSGEESPRRETFDWMRYASQLREAERLERARETRSREEARDRIFAAGRQTGQSGRLFGNMRTDQLSEYLSTMTDTIISTNSLPRGLFDGTVSSNSNSTTFTVPRSFQSTVRMSHQELGGVTFNPNERIRVNADGDVSFREPVTLRLRAHIPEYNYALRGANTLTATMVSHANSEYDRRVQRAAEDIGRNIARSVESSGGNTDRFNADFDGDVTAYIDPRGRGIGAMPQAFNRNPSLRDLAQENLCQEIPLPTGQEEKRYTLDEIKEWLKKSLEVKTEVLESDGDVSVRTTLLLDGEEFSTDEDSVTVNPQNYNYG